jgi:hypothetical protein
MFQGQYGKGLSEFYPKDKAAIKRMTRRRRRYDTKREISQLPPDDLLPDGIPAWGVVGLMTTLVHERRATARAPVPAARLCVGLHDRVRHRRAV